MNFRVFRSRKAQYDTLHTRREQLRALAEQVRTVTCRPFSPEIHFLLGQTYRDPKFYCRFPHLPCREQRRFLLSQRELIVRLERAVAEYERHSHSDR